MSSEDNDTVGERVNPHIVSCLKDLEKKAKQKGYEKQRITTARALRAALQYPLPLKSGHEAKALDGVGPVIAQKIDQYLIRRGLLAGPSTPVKTTTPRKKEYEPNYRSASWALLVALYRNEQTSKGYYKGKMTKKELVAEASPLADTPMTASGGGKLQYSGWKCMKGTLIQKHLVVFHRRMKPQRYSLTPAGRKIAQKLQNYASKMASSDINNSSDSDFEDAEDEVDLKTPEKRKAAKTVDEVQFDSTMFNVSYVSTTMEIVTSKDLAGVRVTHGSLMFLIRVMLPHSSHVPHIQTRIQQVEKQEDNIVYAWIDDSSAPESSEALFDFILPHNIIQACTSTPLRKKEVTPKMNSTEKKRKSHVVHDDENQDVAPTKKRAKLDYNDYMSEHSAPSSCTDSEHLFSPYYKLMLVIDQREKANIDRKYIIDGVSRRVTSKVCQLGLGDMVWIAKDGEHEVVLDFIVERKAIGDLAASIVDGRYKEQRYRLRESGISNVFYIIEGSSLSQGRIPQQNLESALVRLTMSDGFYMRRTATVDMTIELLAEMTNMIRDILDRDGLDMHVITNDAGENMQLSEFNATMAKNRKPLTTSDVFGRQLCCVEGCSVRTAETILEQCGTPRQLIDAFAREGPHMLDNLTIKSNFNTPIGSIGPTLSHMIYDIYSECNHSSD
jgi:crossover junction endonuclease MUS81